MKKKQISFSTRASVAAVRGALFTLAMLPGAWAADEVAKDPAVAALTQPASTVEIGVGDVGRGSFKAGEYNGLQKKGVYGVGNFDLRGGASYTNPDSAQRWRLTGTDLGLETRNLSAEYGEQGKFRINFGYDELLRNRSDSYQTPYNGAGSNSLTLPGNWVVPSVPLLGAGVNARGLSPAVSGSNALVTGVSTAPSAGNLATSAALQAADVPAFHNVDLHTKRTKYDGGLSYNFNTQWEINASLRHEDKNGVKPMATVTRASGGDISTVIPDVIDQTTDQVNASLNYRDQKKFMQVAYYASLFKNNVPSMTWQNWALAAPTMATMSSAPSNQFHQLGLTGGYNFSPTTKLVMNGSYARSTQNDSFLTDASTPLVPDSSLNGLVVSKAFNMRLTAKPVKDLNVAAGYKYDNRDNRTAVNTYGFYDANEPASAAAATATNNAFNAALGLPAGTLKNNANINANRPYSKKINQANLDADYLVAKGQWLKGGYEYQKIDRYCTGTWIDCVDANTTKENTLRAEWRANMVEDLSGRVGYAYSQRKVDFYNENAFLALVPMANVNPGGTATASAYDTMTALGLTGYGPVSGLLPAPAGNQAVFFPSNNALSNTLYGNQNRISELLGMRRFNMADRNRDKLVSSINWQAGEQFSLQGGLNLNRDDYANSTYGLQQANGWALNLDGTYAASENLSISMFYTYEDQRSTSAGNTYTANSATTNVNGFTAISGGCFPDIATRNANNKVDPCLNWSMDMRDKVDTLGIAANQKGLMSGKLDLAGDLTFTRARTDVSGTGGSYANNPLAVAGAPAGTVAAFYIPVSALPTVTTDTIDFRLNGKYALDKATSIRVGYSYRYMKAVDWAYDGMQYGGLSGVLPTNEQAPNYKVNTVAVAWIHTFR